MTSDRLLTRPSLTPKMTARSVPDRPPRSVPGLALDRPRRHSPPAVRWPRRREPDRPASVGRFAGLEPVPDDRVLALVGGDRGDLGRGTLGVVGRLLVALERLDQLRDRRCAEQPGGQDDEPDAHPRTAGRRHVGAELAQLGGPDLGVAPLVAGDPLERLGAARVLLDAGQRVVQDDRVTFQLQVVETALDVDRGHPAILGHHPRVDSPAMPADDPPPLRYLDATAVLAAMPDLDERLRLAERTLTALVADAELPPKIGVHPRPDGLVRPRDARLSARRGPDGRVTTCSG